MTLNLPSDIHVKAVTYGTPRVGNAAWAPYFDSKVRPTGPLVAFNALTKYLQVADFVRINNEKDIIPIVPGRSLGFAHPHGEIHIISPGEAVSCSPDDDATDADCTISTVPDVFDGNILNHLGPYEGVFIGTLFCN